MPLYFSNPSCRFLEPWGCHQAFCVPSCDHRWQVLLLLLLPAQHSGPLCGDGQQQPQKKPPVGHRELAAVWKHSGWLCGGSERQRHQASCSVFHEPAVERFRFLSLPLGNVSSWDWRMQELEKEDLKSSTWQTWGLCVRQKLSSKGRLCWKDYECENWTEYWKNTVDISMNHIMQTVFLQK